MSDLDVAAQAAAAEVKAETAQEDIKDLETEVNEEIEEVKEDIESLENKQNWTNDDMSILFSRLNDLESKLDDALVRIDLLEVETEQIIEQESEPGQETETEPGESETVIGGDDIPGVNPDPVSTGEDKKNNRKRKKGVIGLW